MKKNNLDGIFVSNLSNIIYLTEFSEFSTEDRDAFLLITKNEQYIFTHGIYKEAVKMHLKNFSLIEMSRENPTSKSLETLIAKNSINKLGYEDTDLTVWEYGKLFKNLNKKILVPIHLVEDLRIIKTSHEINSIKKSCALGDKTYSTILQNIRIDITEKQLAFEINSSIRMLGAEPSFPTIVAFGENAAYPHHVPTDIKLKKNIFVLMDFGVKMNNYCSDMTRTVFFGKASTEQKNTYNTVLESQQKAVMQFNYLAIKQSHVNAKKLDDSSRTYILSQNFPNIPHSLGHGIGLEVHEAPSLSPNSQDILKNGMVFSVEPGVYLPGKLGVRIEDLFAIENNKLIQLTKSSTELIEI